MLLSDDINANPVKALQPNDFISAYTQSLFDLFGYTELYRLVRSARLAGLQSSVYRLWILST